LQERKLCGKELSTTYEVNAGIGFFEISCSVSPEEEVLEEEIVELIFQV